MPPNKTATPPLIPLPETVQTRLVAVCREARLLRRLLRLAREAGLPLTTAAQLNRQDRREVPRG